MQTFNLRWKWTKTFSIYLILPYKALCICWKPAVVMFHRQHEHHYRRQSLVFTYTEIPKQTHYTTTHCMHGYPAFVVTCSTCHTMIRRQCFTFASIRTYVPICRLDGRICMLRIGKNHILNQIPYTDVRKILVSKSAIYDRIIGTSRNNASINRLG